MEVHVTNKVHPQRARTRQHEYVLEALHPAVPNEKSLHWASQYPTLH